MNKRQLNGIKKQLNKNMLMHNLILGGVIIMELELKRMNKRQLNGIKKLLNREMLKHKIILVDMELE